jgi:hypothetical protein
VARFRSSQARMRPWIAMVAAYALVLQMLLAGIAASDMAAAEADPLGQSFTVCLGGDAAPVNDDNQLPAPVHHQHCVLCTIATGSAAIEPTAAVLLPAPDLGAASCRATKDARVLSPHPTPKLSQGPPQIA